MLRLRTAVTGLARPETFTSTGVASPPFPSFPFAHRVFWLHLAVYTWLASPRRLISERTVEENILKKANQKRMLGDMAIEGGNFTTAYFKQVLTLQPGGTSALPVGVPLLKGVLGLCRPVVPPSWRCRVSVPCTSILLPLFSPKQTIRELFDMPLEEPSGSSVSSAPEEDEETVASKQTHILEQVTKEWGRLVQCVVAQSTELVQEERTVFAAS